MASKHISGENKIPRLAAMINQNLQQIIPFLQTRCRLLRLRSAFAILTGLLIHSLCNLCIEN
jgi:hypothetical protein